MARGAVVGALRVVLGMRSVAFDKGANAAEKRMGRFHARMQGFQRRIGGIGRRLSIGITAPMAAAAGAALRSSLSVVDAQAKMAQSMDTTVVSIQNLTRASELAGISQNDLEGSLRRMTRRVSLAESGTGPAVKALGRLNIAAADLADLPVDERVNKLVTAIKTLIPEAQQAGVASEIFGDKTGLAMLRLDPETLERAAREVKEFGVAMAEVDADQIEAANDAMSALGLVTRGLSNQLAVALAPTLQFLAEKGAELSRRFAALSPETRKLIGIGAAVAAALGPVAIGLGFVAAGLAALFTPIGGIIFALGAIAGVSAVVAANWDELKARFPILDRLGDIGARLAEVWSGLPAIKWALLIPALRWARFIPGIRWAAFIPKIAWITAAGALKWGALIARLSWSALRVIPVIGWAALAGQLAWSVLVKRIEWSGWIPRVVWADWITRINWSDWIPSIDWSRVFGNAAPDIAAQSEKFGRDLAAGIGRGLNSQKAPTEDELRGFMRDLEGAARDETETQSPSRVFMRLGRDLMDGLGIGIQERTQVAVDALQQGVDQMSGSLDGLGDSADVTSRRFGDMVAGLVTGSQTIGGALSSLGARLASSGISGIAGALFEGSGLGDLFAGFFDRGGTIPRGQFGVAAERGNELVNGVLVPGPAQVTSRAETARMLSGGQASRDFNVTVTMDESTGAFGAFVTDTAGRVVASATPRILRQAEETASSIASEGLLQFERNVLPESVARINEDPRRRG